MISATAHPHHFSGPAIGKPPSHLPRPSAMASEPQKSKERDGVLSTLDVFIQTLSIAKDTCGILPAQVALGSAIVLLTMIRVHFPYFPETGF